MQDDFEKKLKEEFNKLSKDYDRVHNVLWGALAGYEREAYEMRCTSEKIISEGRAGEFLLSIGINDLITDKYIRDCDRDYGKLCKYPDKYKNGKCR